MYQYLTAIQKIEFLFVSIYVETNKTAKQQWPVRSQLQRPSIRNKYIT